MKRTLFLSLFTALTLMANDITLDKIDVSSTVLNDVAQNAKTSADVAQALSTTIPSVDMSRRSGIANDVFIRGQKRDNISITTDGTKIYGACPNRMDPPVSHILANQIDSIEVVEGPYDVENMGTLSGGLKINTKQPSKQEKGQLNLGFGAFNYKKFGASAQGGNEHIRALISVVDESSDQYKDGNGDTLAQQIVNSNAPAGNHYQTRYENMQAYSKKSAMAKLHITTFTNQELRLSVTANRSDNVLYPNSPMDAVYDDSNIYTVAYNIDNLSSTTKNINLQYYYSDVDHPMSTQYRKGAQMNPTKNKTNHMWSKTQGLKLKSTHSIGDATLLLGIDGSKREWRGQYQNNVTGMIMGESISNAVTKNSAMFAKFDEDFSKLHLAIGARYDHTTVKDNDANHQSNTYNALSANVMTTYHLSKTNKLFAGLGHAARVPDGRELYFKQSGATIGTPNLKQTKNTEFDLGYEFGNDSLEFKIKGFYSMLTDYIYIKKGATSNAFYNIDATVYGGELSASYYLTDDISLDGGLSYKRGKKKHPLSGQTNTNLADMAPLRGNLALNYEYQNNSTLTLEMQASDRWDTIDDENGEQVLAGWAIANIKLKHAVNKQFDLTLGMNNIFNTTYAQSNTYADLTLVTAGGGDVMLLNEPGRYFYTNLDFKF